MTLSVGNYSVSCFPFCCVVGMDARFRVASLVSEFPSVDLRYLMCFHFYLTLLPVLFSRRKPRKQANPCVATLKRFVQIRIKMWSTPFSTDLGCMRQQLQ